MDLASSVIPVLLREIIRIGIREKLIMKRGFENKSQTLFP
jgi:hypothetical protein